MTMTNAAHDKKGIERGSGGGMFWFSEAIVVFMPTLFGRGAMGGYWNRKGRSRRYVLLLRKRVLFFFARMLNFFFSGCFNQ